MKKFISKIFLILILFVIDNKYLIKSTSEGKCNQNKNIPKLFPFEENEDQIFKFQITFYNKESSKFYNKNYLKKSFLYFLNKYKIYFQKESFSTLKDNLKIHLSDNHNKTSFDLNKKLIKNNQFELKDLNSINILLLVKTKNIKIFLNLIFKNPKKIFNYILLKYKIFLLSKGQKIKIKSNMINIESHKNKIYKLRPLVNKRKNKLNLFNLWNWNKIRKLRITQNANNFLQKEISFENQNTVLKSFLETRFKFYKNNMTGKKIKIGLLDSGINEEYVKCNVSEKINFTNDTINDTTGHGTYLASVKFF